MSAGLMGQATAQIRVGSIAQVHGNANVERNGRTVPATPTLSIIVGDELKTSRQSELTVQLVDGSELTLSDSTSIVIGRTMMGASRIDSAIALFKGKLHSVVNPTGGSLPNFEIHTPNAVAGVRGTDFETEYIEGKPCPGFPQCLRYTDVGVYEGIVEVRNPTSSKPIRVQVTSGYETTVPCELPPAPPGPLGIGDLTAPGYH
jgi:hypothetical protein